MDKTKKRRRTPELAYDACVYFTDDFSLFNAEIGKYIIALITVIHSLFFKKDALFYDRFN